MYLQNKDFLLLLTLLYYNDKQTLLHSYPYYTNDEATHINFKIKASNRIHKTTTTSYPSSKYCKSKKKTIFILEIHNIVNSVATSKILLN